jgi:hypothetical protein
LSVFFTDRDLGVAFPAILREGGLDVERHSDHFRPDCPDDEWIAEVATRGWVAITHDGRIRYKPNELAAVVRHDLALLVVVGKAPYADLARSFVATYAKITRFLESHAPPLIAKVYRASPQELRESPNAPGRVELWYPEPTTRRRAVRR